MFYATIDSELERISTVSRNLKQDVSKQTDLHFAFAFRSYSMERGHEISENWFAQLILMKFLVQPQKVRFCLPEIACNR